MPVEWVALGVSAVALVVAGVAAKYTRDQATATRDQANAAEAQVAAALEQVTVSRSQFSPTFRAGGYCDESDGPVPGEVVLVTLDVSSSVAIATLTVEAVPSSGTVGLGHEDDEGANEDQLVWNNIAARDRARVLLNVRYSAAASSNSVIQVTAVGPKFGEHIEHVVLDVGPIVF